MRKRSINKEEEQKFVEQNDRVQKFVDERLAQAARQTLTRHKYNYWNSKKDEAT
jgi:16S rRNA U1498 N3-methylase RsmE